MFVTPKGAKLFKIYYNTKKLKFEQKFAQNLNFLAFKLDKCYKKDPFRNLELFVATELPHVSKGGRHLQSVSSEI